VVVFQGIPIEIITVCSLSISINVRSIATMSRVSKGYSTLLENGSRTWSPRPSCQLLV